MAEVDCSIPLFVLSVLATVIVVAVPAEKTDVDNTRADGYPRGTEIDQTELCEHIPPTLIAGRNVSSPVKDNA